MSIQIKSEAHLVTSYVAVCGDCGECLFRSGKARLTKTGVLYSHFCLKCNVEYLLPESFPVVRAGSGQFAQNYQSMVDEAAKQPMNQQRNPNHG